MIERDVGDTVCIEVLLHEVSFGVSYTKHI